MKPQARAQLHTTWYPACILIRLFLKTYEGPRSRIILESVLEPLMLENSHIPVGLHLCRNHRMGAARNPEALIREFPQTGDLYDPCSKDFQKWRLFTNRGPL